MLLFRVPAANPALFQDTPFLLSPMFYPLPRVGSYSVPCLWFPAFTGSHTNWRFFFLFKKGYFHKTWGPSRLTGISLPVPWWIHAQGINFAITIYDETKKGWVHFVQATSFYCCEPLMKGSWSTACWSDKWGSSFDSKYSSHLEVLCKILPLGRVLPWSDPTATWGERESESSLDLPTREVGAFCGTQ